MEIILILVNRTSGELMNYIVYKFSLFFLQYNYSFLKKTETIAALNSLSLPLLSAGNLCNILPFLEILP